MQGNVPRQFLTAWGSCTECRNLFCLQTSPPLFTFWWTLAECKYWMKICPVLVLTDVLGKGKSKKKIKLCGSTATTLSSLVNIFLYNSCHCHFQPDSPWGLTGPCGDTPVLPRGHHCHHTPNSREMQFLQIPHFHQENLESVRC